ncbi:MAG: hypothetical protein JST39_25500, partial [Bacteroidetes bacterium]|nr:hypothetical protein [Bacteroidota bacterium]
TREDAAGAGFDDSMIYEEIAVPFEERKITMNCIGKKDGMELFAFWKDKKDRIDY